MRFAERSTFLALAIILMGSGCSMVNQKKGGNQKEIVGTWVIDAEATLASLKSDPMWEQMPDDAKKQITVPMLTEKLGALSVIFTKTTVAMPGMPEHMAYTVKSSEGNTLVIGIINNDQKADIMIEFKGRDTMQFKTVGPTSLAMKGIWSRQK